MLCASAAVRAKLDRSVATLMSTVSKAVCKSVFLPDLAHEDAHERLLHIILSSHACVCIASRARIFLARQVSHSLHFQAG